jgi:hypothetical protein
MTVYLRSTRHNNDLKERFNSVLKRKISNESYGDRYV